MEEERQYHPLPISTDNEVTKSLRDLPPAHYTLKIDSFSVLATLMDEAEVKNYESGIFEAGGYEWKLSLYRKGDKERHGEGYISLYLVIQGTDDLPPGWEVNVNFKFFVYDQIQDKYLTIQDVDGKVRRFHRLKTEWGFAKLLSLSSFQDAANGYLVSKKCVFGAEVLVINNTGRGECVNVLEGLESTYIWKIRNFSSLDGVCKSEVFTLQGGKWKILLYPKEYGDVKNGELAIYLQLEELKVPCPSGKVFAEYVLRLKDQKNGNDKEITHCHDFSSARPEWGTHKFLSSAAKLHDASRGFLVNDTLIIEAEIITISTIEPLSKLHGCQPTDLKRAKGESKKTKKRRMTKRVEETQQQI